MNRKVPEELCVFFLRDIRCPVTCADFDTSVEKDRCNHFHTSETCERGKKTTWAPRVLLKLTRALQRIVAQIPSLASSDADLPGTDTHCLPRARGPEGPRWYRMDSPGHCRIGLQDPWGASKGLQYLFIFIVTYWNRYHLP
ncbi:hypothetical protein MG293_016987 [Ovis ammon polii]|uniref:Uncharacterized protein n=1 Tax=Ovis ammon polii TaxID=230172 RepID=A0AAD4Y429_OVIAM|nr:hypothetical protein MG293_016987 [Ovis ammon polii]